jgi:TetR/AcrR family transcriptional repressor of nem operon
MTAKHTDLTRQKLLDAAFCEIHRQGFQAASIANILQDTGLTKGALYHHFPTKRDLGLAVVDEVIHGRLEERIFRRLRDSERPVQALLQVIGDMAQNRDPAYVTLGCPLNNLMQEMSPLDAGFKERLNGILATWGRMVEDALRRGQEAGEVRGDVDCRAVHRLRLGGLRRHRQEPAVGRGIRPVPAAAAGLRREPDDGGNDLTFSCSKTIPNGRYAHNQGEQA